MKALQREAEDLKSRLAEEGRRREEVEGLLGAEREAVQRGEEARVSVEGEVRGVRCGGVVTRGWWIIGNL